VFNYDARRLANARRLMKPRTRRRKEEGSGMAIKRMA
jgi:hypothetical protein